MRPSNFPARQNARRKGALARLSLPTAKHKVDELSLNIMAKLVDAASARAVRTKKDRREFAKVRR